ncbi:winged helix DNA-binding domain-containing protein [Wallemia mellicola]|nr:winged helix DNA-binding domain-containing protein [Wallemia mellicola]TIC52178.1 winged helix DNA-binding domain-containing protein [Wallemia mellicola]
MSRRYNKGIGSLQHHHNATAYQNLSNTINDNQLQAVKQQLDVFKDYLKEFSIKHRKDIESNVEFRNRFTQMCATIGVDPLNIARDFYLSLAVQLVDMCISTTTLTGGLVRLSDILKALSIKRNTEITLSDIQKAIKILQPLHDNQHLYEIIPINQILYLRSQPKELNNDQMLLLTSASTNNGWVDQSLLQSNGWSIDRARNSLRQAVMDDGIVWIDNQEPQIKYYFPALFQGVVNTVV